MTLTLPQLEVELERLDADLPSQLHGLEEAEAAPIFADIAEALRESAPAELASMIGDRLQELHDRMFGRA